MGAVKASFLAECAFFFSQIAGVTFTDDPGTVARRACPTNFAVAFPTYSPVYCAVAITYGTPLQICSVAGRACVPPIISVALGACFAINITIAIAFGTPYIYGFACGEMFAIRAYFSDALTASAGNIRHGRFGLRLRYTEHCGLT